MMRTGVQSRLLGESWGFAHAERVLSGDFVQPPDSSPNPLLVMTIVVAVLGVLLVVFTVGMRRPGQRLFERPTARESLGYALFILGSALGAVSILLFARHDDSGNTVLFLLVRGYAGSSPTTPLVMPLVFAALGAASLTCAVEMHRSVQEVDRRLVTRADLERALVVVGSALVTVAVVLFTLVPDGRNAPLLETFGTASSGSGQVLRDSSITLAALGTVLLIGGAWMKWHERSIARADVERVLLALGSATVSLAIVRIGLVGDAMGLRVFLPESLDYPNGTPALLPDSTIIMAALGIALLIIGAAMRTARRRT